jgi:hypothetical protein
MTLVDGFGILLLFRRCGRLEALQFFIRFFCKILAVYYVQAIIPVVSLDLFAESKHAPASSYRSTTV